MPAIDPYLLLKHYEAGAITGHELLIGLVQVAAEKHPEQIALLISSELLLKIRETSSNPPSSPDEMVVFHLGMHSPGFDLKAFQREQARLWYDGLWRWHQYFNQIEGGI
jgi:hypothetical protein